MSEMTITLAEVERDLRRLLHSVPPNESVTVVDENGVAIARFISLQGEEAEEEKQDIRDWLERMEAFAEQVDKAWKGDEGGVETLSRMRR
jgi:antitoxin (DNA-binding transcriptional repressor) of toxin-antitoxin stability system